MLQQLSQLSVIVLLVIAVELALIYVKLGKK
jgi:hypothetical protein